MSGIRYDEISYPEIITFLNVAQTLNMSVTAQTMHISQPAVSKRIANLEKRFHLILFQRLEGGLQITPAGKVLYQELLQSVAHLKNGLTKAQEMQSAPGRVLKICYDSFFDLPILHQIIRDFSARQPTVRVEASRYHDNEMEDCSALFSNKADFLICPDSFSHNYEQYLDRFPIASLQFYILISKDHPLARRGNVTPGDLVGVPLIATHNHSSSPYVKTIQSLFAFYGFVPQIGHLTTRGNLCFEIVSRSGVAIATPEFWRRMSPRASGFFEENILAFPIEDAFYPVSLFWRKTANDSVVEEFVRTFQSYLNQPENAKIIQQAYNQ